MPRAILVLAAALTLLVAVVGARLFAFTAWVGPVHVAIGATLAVLALATVAAAWRRSAAMHLAVAIALLTAQLGIIATSLAGVRVVAFELFPSKRVAIVIGAALALAIYGLVRRRLWARWLGLALAAAGMLSGGLNAVGHWSVTAGVHPQYADWSMQMFLQAFVYWVGALGGALVIVNLAAPAVGAASPDAAWTASPETRWIRATIIAAMAAVPMLLVYAWLQPITPATQPTAIALAAALAIGATLAIRGKLAGALVLVVAGAGLLAQAAATAAGAPEALGRVAFYYAAFWVPAGLVALGCGIRLAAPVWRLLRR